VDEPRQQGDEGLRVRDRSQDDLNRRLGDNGKSDGLQLVECHIDLEPQRAVERLDPHHASAVDGLFRTADIAETSRNSGIKKVTRPANCATTDGTHPSVAMHALRAAAISPSPFV
jgi:hypothetical protein